MRSAPSAAEWVLPEDVGEQGRVGLVIDNGRLKVWIDYVRGEPKVVLQVEYTPGDPDARLHRYGLPLEQLPALFRRCAEDLQTLIKPEGATR